MSQRRLRSSSRHQANSDNNTSEPITTSITTSTSQTTTSSTNGVTPLLSIRFHPGTGPRTHSSPGSESTITTPTYSSITAREISGQESDTVRRNTGNMNQQDRNLPTVSEERDRNDGVSREIISIREYVSASVEAAQASIMREVQNMQLMIPQLIRESLRSEQGNSFENQNNQNRPFLPNNNFQTPFNTNNRQPTLPNPQSIPPFQQRQPNIPQQLFANDSQNFSNPSLDMNLQQHHSYKPITPNQLDKWGLKFDGSNKTLTVEDFVFRVELLRTDYNCPWDVLLKGFHHLVTGNASSWFWAFRMKNPTYEWHTLKYHLIKKFRNFESDFEIQRRIMERRQAPNESADSFITEIVKLKNQMRLHVDEAELVKIVKDNLKDGLAQLVFPITIYNFDHLLEECKRAERNISKRSSHRMPLGNPRKIYEIEMHNDPEEDEQVRLVEALQKDKLPAKQLVCWNCKTSGHSFIECPVVQRNVFCYRCGFDGVTSPTCPRCVGNTKLNTRGTGPVCSSQNMSQ